MKDSSSLAERLPRRSRRSGTQKGFLRDYTDEVPFEGLQARSPFQGITLRSHTAQTDRRTCSHLAGLSCPPCQTQEYATRAAILKEPKSRTKSKTGGGNASEFGTVTIDFNPGPDAEDRLRRLFSLLFSHVASEGEADSGEGLPAAASAKDGAALDSPACDTRAGGEL